MVVGKNGIETTQLRHQLNSHTLGSLFFVRLNGDLNRMDVAWMNSLRRYKTKQGNIRRTIQNIRRTIQTLSLSVVIFATVGGYNATDKGTWESAEASKCPSTCTKYWRKVVTFIKVQATIKLFKKVLRQILGVDVDLL